MPWSLLPPFGFHLGSFCIIMKGWGVSVGPLIDTSPPARWLIWDAFGFHWGSPCGPRVSPRYRHTSTYNYPFGSLCQQVGPI